MITTHTVFVNPEDLRRIADELEAEVERLGIKGLGRELPKRLVYQGHGQIVYLAIDNGAAQKINMSR